MSIFFLCVVLTIPLSMPVYGDWYPVFSVNRQKKREEKLYILLLRRWKKYGFKWKRSEKGTELMLAECMKM